MHFECSQRTQKPSDLKVRERFTFFSPQLTSLLTKTVFLLQSGKPVVKLVTHVGNYTL